MFLEGNRVILKEVHVQNLNVLENKVYSLHKTESGVFYLSEREKFILPSVLYGDIVSNAERILKSFQARNSNTGVLLSGYKGSGKTMLGKLISIQSELPVITVSENFEGSDFFDAISHVKQQCVIFIDEFEKIYSDNKDAILALLDGVYESKKLFLLTTNSLNISEFMLNRLGRIRYHIHYDTLSYEEIVEVVDDKLLNTKHRDSLIDLLQLVGYVSYDNVLGVIEELNIHEDLSPPEALNLLNISVTDARYDVLVFYEGHRAKTTTYGHPLAHPFMYLWFEYVDKREQKKYVNYRVSTKELSHTFSAGKLTITDKEGNKFIYTLSQDYKFKFDV